MKPFPLEHILINDFPVVISTTEKRLFITSDPDVSLLRKTMEEHEIDYLSIIDYFGYSNNNLDFLFELKKHIRSLTLFFSRPINLEAVNSLHLIENLKLNFERSSPIDFKNLKNLKICSLDWQKGDESIFNCNKLEKLYISKYPMINLKELSHFPYLIELSITGRIVSIEGIGNLVRLQKLNLTDNRKLISLEELGVLENLTELYIENSPRITNIDSFSGMKQLTKLELLCRTKIQSIKSLHDLVHLNMVRLVGIEVLDGDVSPLIGKGHIVFGTFPYYNYTMKQIEEINKNMR